MSAFETSPGIETSMHLCLGQVYLLTHLSCSQVFATLTMFEKPDLFPHQDPNFGDRKTKQNMEQRMVLFAKGSAIGEHKENGN